MQLNTVDQFSASVLVEHQDNCADECCPPAPAEAAAVGKKPRKPRKQQSQHTKWTLPMAQQAYAECGFLLEATEYKSIATPMPYFCPLGGHRHTMPLSRIINWGANSVCGACRAWTIEKVRKVFAERGWDLLETVYVNCSTLMRFWCRKGQHEHQIRMEEVVAGNGCGGCKFHRTYESVKADFDAAGLDLLAVSYENTYTLLPYYCRAGQHEHSMTMNDLASGIKCGKCRYWTIAEAQELFAAADFDLRETVYKTNVTPMLMWCRKGQHEHRMTLNSVLSGNGCGKCKDHWTLDTARAAYAEQNLTLMAEEYVNVSTPMPYFCYVGMHIHEMSLASLIYGNAGCGACHFWTIEEARVLFNKAGMLLLVDVMPGRSVPLPFICRVCLRQHAASLDSIIAGSGCGLCRPGGFNPNFPGILYYVVFTLTSGRTVYKIGITKHDADKLPEQAVYERYRKYKGSYSIVWTKLFKNGTQCYETEKTLVRYYRKLRCADKPVDGLSNNELYDFDVMPTIKAMQASLREAAA